MQYKKFFLALTIFAALAVMSACGLRAQWVQMNKGINGGNVLTLAAYGPYFFAGTTGGVFRALDNGSDLINWTGMNNGLTGDSIFAFATAGTNLFAGTDSGVFLSIDYGESWGARNTGLPVNAKVRTFSVVDTILYAGTDTSVFLSTDNGISWTLVSAGLTHVSIVALAAIDTSLIVGTNAGVFLSNNRGKNWTKGNFTWNALAQFAVIDTEVFALQTPPAGGVFRSIDRGLTWSLADTGLNISGTAIYAKGRELFLAGFSYYRGGLAYLVYASTNSGAIWEQLSDTLSTALTALVAGSAPWSSGLWEWELLGGSKGGGVINAYSGNELNDSLINNEIPSLTVCDSAIFAVSDISDFFWGVYRSTDEGANWTCFGSGLPGNGEVYTTDYNPSAFAVSGSDIYLAISNYYGVYHSSDLGASWTLEFNWDNSGGSLPIVFYYLWVSGENILAGATGGIIVSTDKGISWNWSTDSVTRTDIYAFAEIDSELFAWTPGRFIFSTDQGLNWTAEDTAFIHYYVNAFTSEGENLLAGTDIGIFISTDKGYSWRLASNGLPYDSTYDEYPSVNCFAIDGINIFAGTSNGVFLSTNNGANWTLADSVSSVYAVSLAISGKYIYAAGNGVWRRPLSEMIHPPSNVEEAPLTSLYGICGYPNPFSQSTQITFTSVSAGYADISIANLLGEQVAHIFSGEIDAGSHNFTFTNNTTSLPDGIYECIVRMNGRVETLPLVLIR